MPIDPDDPPRVFVFANHASPIAVMNLRITGTFVSPAYAAMADPAFAEAYVRGDADLLPYVPNPDLSTGFMSPFTTGVLNDYRLEYDAELHRRGSAPDAPSRLTAVFAFEDLATCERVHARYGWDLGEVVEMRVVDVLKARRVNMEIVSLARDAYRSGMLSPELVERLWRSYWSGSDGFALELPTVDGTGRRQASAGVLWELLIDGKLVRADRWTPDDGPRPAQP